MKYQLEQWQRLRSALIGVMLMLPLVPLFSPSIAAWASDGDIWCVTLPSGPGQPDRSSPAVDAEACLVCLAAAIGGNSATPHIPHASVPADLILEMLAPGSLPVAEPGFSDGNTPIRAPPLSAMFMTRDPASCVAGCALT